MHQLSDLCFLCLVHDKNIKLKDNNFLQMREKFRYLIPEHIFHSLESPKYVCNGCINSLNKINAFRIKCFENIAIYNQYEQKLTQCSDSNKYSATMFTNILHQNNAELDCDIEIKTEIYEENSNIQNDIKNNETCKVTEDEKQICNELNYNREVKNEVCQTNYFKPPTEYPEGEISNNMEIHKVFIKVEDKMENNYIKHEINEEFMIKEDNEQEYISGIRNVEQQEQFCNQNVPGNFAANENDFNTAVSMCIRNQDLLQNKEMIKCKKYPETYTNKQDPIHTKKSQKCDVCQKTFDRLDHLKIHKLVHTGEKPYMCDVCQKAFNRIENLKKHRLVHTGEKPHACDICEKTFSQRCHLKAHKFVHTGEKPFVCDVCQKAFNRKVHLKNHKLTHGGDKPHACDVCQKAFSEIGNLNKHKIVHTDEKPHVCDVCQKAFNRKDSLKTHKLIHSGDKPHACDICQKTFSDFGNLKKHKLVHTDEKPFVCDVCQKAFIRKTSLKSHKLIHHSEKPN